MNYRKYRKASRILFEIPLLVAILAAGAYAVLTYFDFIEAPFEWEYLAALGGVVAIGAFLSFWVFCISCSVKKKAEKLANEPASEEEQVMDACAEAAVEPERIYIQQPTYLSRPEPQRTNLHISFEGCNTLLDGPSRRDKMKKVAMIASPSVAVTAGVAAVLAAKARKKQKIKLLLRDLEHVLGCRK